MNVDVIVEPAPICSVDSVFVMSERGLFEYNKQSNYVFETWRYVGLSE